jgi:hypothetical protein
MFAVLEFTDILIIALLILFCAGAAGSTVIKRGPSARRQERLEWAVGRLEKKLDLLLAKAGIEAPPPPKLPEEAVQALREGMVSRATEAYERATGASHAEARAVVEDAYQRKAF